MKKDRWARIPLTPKVLMSFVDREPQPEPVDVIQDLGQIGKYVVRVVKSEKGPHLEIRRGLSLPFQGVYLPLTLVPALIEKLEKVKE